MTPISAAQVKALREKTGAGMMDCKNALVEAQGDVDAAIEWLRARGLARAAQRAQRVAAEGLVGLLADAGQGVLIELNAETDFVARNETFMSAAAALTRTALTVKGDRKRLLACLAPDGDGTICDFIVRLVATIGEQIVLRRTAFLSAGGGTLVSYLHGTVSPELGRVGVLVALESAATTD